MRKAIFGFIAISLLALLFPHALYAQTEVHDSERSLALLSQQIHSTPTPTMTQSLTATPTPTVSPTPQPELTAQAPTPVPVNITPTPTVNQTTQSVSSSTVMDTQPSPPPPPPAPRKPVAITESLRKTIDPVVKDTDPVAATMEKYLTVPFAISTHYLPKNFYIESSLSKQESVELLIFAFMSIGAGCALLYKPALARWTEKQHFSLNREVQKDREFSIPRIIFPKSL